MEKYNLEQTGQEVQNILNEATPQSELAAEVERAQEAERLLGEGIQQNADDIDAIEGKIPSAASSENKLTDKEYVDGKVDDEKNRAQDAEQQNANDIDAIEAIIPSNATSENKLATSNDVDTVAQSVGTEETRAKAAEKQNADDIDAIEEKIPSSASSSNQLATASDVDSLSSAIEAILLLIPSAASSLNQLADKAFVNSSIATNTATFRGTYNLITDLDLTISATYSDIASALADVVSGADNNDYAFVQIPTSDATPTQIAKTVRFKFNGTSWEYEYDLNNSGYTAAQWAAINSGITAALVAKLNGLPTADALQLALNAITQDIDNLEAVVPTEATSSNQLADKAFVLNMILLATPAFKGQFTTLTQLQAVTGAKTGDMGIVRTKDHDGKDVFTFYQYKDDQWNEFYTLAYHPQDKPATTGIIGDYPYNGMGRIELPMNLVDGWPDDTWLYLPVNGVVYLLYSWNLQLYAVYNSGAQEGLGLENNIVIEPASYNIADIAELVGSRYLSYTEAGGVFTITKPDTTTTTSTVLNNTTIYKEDDTDHHGINILTQSMLNKINTIYVIRYDYVLGENITVPANCVLEFDGGSLSNGTITGQNTNIVASNIGIFDAVSISGVWIVPVINSSWFKDATTTDNAIKQLFNLQNDNIQNIINIDNGNYYVSVQEEKETAIKIGSNTVLNLNGNIILRSNALSAYYIVSVGKYISNYNYESAENVKISGSGSIQGEKDTHAGSAGEAGMCVLIVGNNIRIDGIKCLKGWGDAIYIRDAYNVIIENCKLHDCRRQGITIIQGHDINIKNNEIYNVTETAPKSAIDLEPWDNQPTQLIYGIRIKDNYIHNVSSGILVVGSTRKYDIQIIDNTIQGTGDYGIYVQARDNTNNRYDNIVIDKNTISGFICSYTCEFVDKLSICDNTFTSAPDVADPSGAEIREHVTNCDNVVIEDNLINARGLTVSGGMFGIKNNKFLSNGYSKNFTIGIYDARNTKIIENNYFGGSVAINSNGAILENNTIVGIVQLQQNDIIVRGNRIEIAIIADYTQYISARKQYSFTSKNAIIENNRIVITADSPSGSMYNSNYIKVDDDNCIIRDNYFPENVEGVTLPGVAVSNNGTGNYIQLQGKEPDGAVVGVKRFGTWADRPGWSSIYAGFRYFCTDKQTAEGHTNGIEIICKGYNSWVDALGRVVS